MALSASAQAGLVARFGDEPAASERLRRELDPEIPAVLVTGSITPGLEQMAQEKMPPVISMGADADGGFTYEFSDA